MKNLAQYIDATFLKTQADGFTSEQLLQKVDQLIEEAHQWQVKLVMIRPEYVLYAKKKLQELSSKVAVGTVIDFPLGNGGIERKIQEAHFAIQQQADELDFVIDYRAFQMGAIDRVKEEVFVCTQVALQHNKIAKWIIETAALSDREIICLTSLIKNVVISKFSENDYERVFIKSSTGFYPTEAGTPNGATMHNITMMLENATPLPVKAAGGVRTKEEALQMISLGVKRIGTSSHVSILK